MSDEIKLMISEEDVNERIKTLADKISKDFEGESVFLAIVLRGAVFFGCELAKRINIPVTIDFLTASSYGSGTVSSGHVMLKRDLELDIKGKNVIVVEDIIDTGNTLKAVSELLTERGAKCVKLCALLDKPDRRQVQVDMDYVGFSIPDEFVVGYGLDFDQKYRNLPYIGKVVL